MNDTIPESVVAAQLGLTLKQVHQFRKPDWVQKKGRGWQWLPEGVRSLQEMLAELNGAKAALPQEVTVNRCVFEVVRVRNARVLHVVKPGEKVDPKAAPVCVWLPRPVGFALFRRGMKVLAMPRNGREGLWDLVGNPDKPNGRRFPRRPGTW